MISANTKNILIRLFKRVDLTQKTRYIEYLNVRIQHENSGFAAESVGFTTGNTLTIEELESCIQELNKVDEDLQKERIQNEYMIPFMM